MTTDISALPRPPLVKGMPILHSLVPILKNPEQCKEMGVKARKHVELALDWKVHTEKAKEIFKT